MTWLSCPVAAHVIVVAARKCRFARSHSTLGPRTGLQDKIGSEIQEQSDKPVSWQRILR